MDIVLGLIIAGCLLAGLFWGAIRLASTVAAAIAAIVVARLAGPPAAQMFAGGGGPPSGTARLAAMLVTGLLAAILVVLAGRGLRRGIEALHLSCLDRLAGAALAGAVATAVCSCLLALAATGGWRPTTPWATRLTEIGAGILATQTSPASTAIPSNTPAPATSKGQHPA